MSIRSIIVDDEPFARNIIKKFLKDESDIELLGECGDGVEAVEMIKRMKPDLVFLDIQMPEMDGFDVINSIGIDNIPNIVFVTAYDKYAIKAFEINAVDYLLKPFDKKRFHESISRIRKLMFSRQNIKQQIGNILDYINKEQKYLDRILVKTRGRIIFLKTDEIDWIKSEAYYVKFHVGKHIHVIRETLSNLENNLDPNKFVRIHKSYIVNIEFIKELQQWFKNKYLVILKDGTELKLSRNYQANLFSLFKSIKK